MSEIQVKNICGLSPVQEGMYFHYLMNKSNDPYVIQSMYELLGTVSADRLKEAFDVLVQRHDCLRTLFMHQKTPDPVQIILKSREVPFTYSDLTDSEHPDTHIQSYLKSDREKGFDLARDPLVRLHLFHCERDRYRLVMTLHHIILDGWSSGIIERELFMIYAGGSYRAEVENPVPVSYAQYIKWLKSQSNDDGIEYFKRLLGSKPQISPFIENRKRTSNAGEEVHARIEFISGPQTQKLKSLASDLRVTTADILRTAWALTVSRVTGYHSFTTLHTVSGRPTELHGSSDMVGMFINAIVQPFSVEDRSIQDAIRSQHESFAHSMPWQHLSLSQIAKSLSLSGELSDNLVVLENYPDLGDERSALEREMGFSFKPVASEESTNYPVTVQFHVGSTIEVRFFMKKAWFSEDDLVSVKDAFEVVVDEILRDVFKSVTAITDTKEGKSAPEQPKEAVSLFITSNFTDNNVVPYLKWWMDQAGFEASIRLADYNTVLQQLSDSESALYSHHGPKFLLIKVSDLARFKLDLDAQQVARFLDDTLRFLTLSLENNPASGPIIVILTPDQGQHQSGLSSESIRQIGDQFVASTSRNTAIKVIDLRDAPLRNGDLFDGVTDQMGHIPYTEAGYSYLAGQITRSIRAWKHQPFKVIALDADNTLWKGILGEDGVQGIEITPAHRYVQEFALRKKNEGFLLALCTKNNATDVDELFRVREDMVLNADDFVSIAANWGAKSANLKSIAEELNLGIDSFIFLDDSELEIREVHNALPEVLALKLPEDTTHWKLFLNRNWAFDSFVVTQEDRQRTSMYLAEKKRKEIAESKVNNEDFITQLGVNTRFFGLNEHNLDRIEQLTQRTNQFNLNGQRFTKSDLLDYASKPDHWVYALSVSDRFGDYGITGAIFARQDDHAITVDAWMLSCRVLARGVEQHVVQHLGDIASNHSADLIRFQHKITPKNAPIQQFLSTEGFTTGSDANSEMIQIEISVERLKDIPKLGNYGVFERTHELDEHTSSTKSVTLSKLQSQSAIKNESDEFAEYWIYTDAVDVGQHPRNRRYVVELTRLSPVLLEECRAQDNSTSVVEAQYAEPVTSTEVRIAAIWKSLLESDRIGRHHDFFLLGGNSLMATRLASRIYREFHVEIELGTIFQHSILSDFCEVIDRTSGENPAKIAPIKRNEQDHHPLSAAQHRIWRSEQLFEAQAGYVLGGMYKIKGTFDVDRLKSALKSLTKVHDSLRTTFPVINGEPRQVIHDEIAISILDLSHFGDISDPEGVSDAFFSKKMDLENGPLLQAGYSRINDNEHLLALKIHHLVTDGWSQGILMSDLLKFYESSEAIESRSEVRFVDFVHWSTSHETSLHDTAGKFWKKELSGELDRVTLPYDFSRPSVIRQSPKQFKIDLEKRFVESVNAFSRKHQLSLYMTMMASVQLLLQRYTGKNDIIVGSPFSGRTHPDVQQTIGFFVNTLPFRMNSTPDSDLQSWLKEIRQKTIQLLELQHYSLDSILSEMNIEHDQRPPLFDILLLVQEKASTEETSSHFKVDPVGSEHLGAGYDLVFQVFDSPTGWELVIEYQPELYHERSIGMVAEHWKALLSNLVRTSLDKTVSKVTAFNDALESKVVQLGAGAKKEYPRQTLVEVFKDAVRQHPKNSALINELHQSISYVELDRRTDLLARKLKSLGVNSGDRVVVNIELKSQVIECMLAIMKCRAVYVPVDIETPLTRTQHILEVAKPKIWIRDLIDSNNEVNSGISLISISELDSMIIEESEWVLPSHANPDEMAYIIFTSGSTGRPKGVAVHHQGLINMSHSHVRNSEATNLDRVLCFASISFDASLSEFFMAILAGATMVIPPTSIRKDAFEFIQYMNELKVTIITLPPVFLASLNQPELPYLKSIVTAGEAARKTDALHYAKNKRYINAYGPTECSVGTNAHIVDAEGEYPTGIPIGRAYDNVQLMVLDEALNLSPFGAQGQLAVHGVQVALGYYGNEELTSKSFINHPLFPGKTYLTGDQVRWNFNGELEFIGRNDSQVKVRGYRIELDEVKHQLDLIDAIKVSFIRVMEDKSGEKQIVAYIVEKESISNAELRSLLFEKLPNYMIPGIFERVDEIKLTINGKVDTKSLPDPFSRHDHSDLSLDHTSDSMAKNVLLETLHKYLPTSGFELSKSFLQSGGDSIKAIQVAHHLQQVGFNVRAGKLYEFDTLNELLTIMEATGTASESRPKIAQGLVDCTPMQVRFFNEVTRPKQENAFWMQAGYKIDKPIPAELITKMVSEIVDYHEIFRMRFVWVAEIPKVEVLAAPSYQIVNLNTESRTFEQDLEAYWQQLKGFINIETGALASFLVVNSTATTYIYVTIHHLVVDATSLRVLRDQIQWMTRQYETGSEIRLKGNFITQREWMNYIHELQPSVGDTQRWETLFNESGMTIDRSKPCVSSATLGIDQTTQLLRISKMTKHTIDSVLLALAHKSLSSYLQMPSMRVGIESQGRKAGNSSTDIGSTLGWFTLEYPIRLTSNDDLSAILDEIAEQTQDVPLDGLHAVMIQNRLHAKQLPLSPPEIGYNYLGEFETITKLATEWTWDSRYLPEHTDFDHKWHPIELSALIEDGKLKIRMQSNTSKLNQEILERLSASILDDLRQWIQSTSETLTQKPVLVFFPFVASNARFFDTFKKTLDDQFEVLVLELPGHGARVDEPLLDSLDAACDDLIRQMSSIKSMSKSRIWLGHSMGAYLALACAKLLEKDSNLGPSGIIFSDVAAPGQFEKWIVGNMNREQKEEYYRRLGYDAIIQTLDEVTREHFESIIRADLSIVRPFVNSDQPKVNVPATFMYSKQDSVDVKDFWLGGWQQLCVTKLISFGFDHGHIDWLQHEANTEVLKTVIYSILSRG